MNLETFNKIIAEQVQRSTTVLIDKAEEYATEDRLHNFKVAAEFLDSTLEKACAGMMAKHTVSIYDKCNSGKTYPMSMWNEKITDHINYLLLLRAIVDKGEVTMYADGVPYNTVSRE